MKGTTLVIDLLKTWGVPGGLISVVVGAILQRWFRTNTEPKTPTEAVHRAEAAQIAKDTGLEDKWQQWAERVEANANQQLAELRSELAGVRRELADLRAENEATLSLNNQLVGYAWQLRADITVLGHEPRPWPANLDPERPGRTDRKDPDHGTQ